MSSVSETNTPSTSTKRLRRRANGEGSVYWDSTKRKYVAAFIDINGKRQRDAFATEDEAHEWRTSQKIARKRGEATYARNPKRTLSKFLDEWLNCKDDLSPNGLRSYRQAIEIRINPHLGKVHLKDLNPKLIENFIKELRVNIGYSDGTVKGVIRTLNAAFNDGVRWGEIPANPMTKVKIPKLVSKPSPRIPRNVATKLRKVARSNPFDRARLEVGISIGLRPGEVAGLKWKDLDIFHKHLYVERQIQRVKGVGLVECKPKTLRSAPIPLLDDQVSILTSLLNAQYGDRDKCEVDNEYIFKNSVGGPMDSKFDTKWFRKLCDRAGVPRYQKYQMRKTAFTELNHHTDLPTVKAYSGHTQISTLERHYIDPDEGAIRTALVRCNEAIKVAANKI